MTEAKGAPVVDEPLRLRALEVLGALGELHAREALEHGSVSVEHDVRGWEGSHGTVHAHRVVVGVSRELYTVLVATHAARDALEGSLAAAMAERAQQSVADVRIEVGPPRPPPSSPYR